ncbi:GNAT family N-acetyltransferase [Brachybacterium avium]|uniref:GNAT family N-acetyltransferase n=1 Tax=Brachybacterium avium TaxID=2017485 RepID=A0A220UEE2_9MICO|nr:GNAT family N-acetyltransferase [Brachybacterium avium]ASK66262.1 GNAT family N-acetyltransferase [Brachybacterium avium]
MTAKDQHSTVWRGPVTDQELSSLHAAAFDHPEELEPWTERLERYSLGWVTVRRDERLVGFCNIITDGGHHAFLLDVIVQPGHQGTGIGKELVHRAIEECRSSAVDWLHVDFEADLGPFYMTEGLFRRSTAGILKV